MKTVIGSVVAAVAASACCLGPVVFSVLGAGALGAAATQLEPYRPIFLGLTFVLLGAAYYVTYRPQATQACGPGGSCSPSSKNTATVVLGIVTVIVVLLAAFPYYVSWFV